MSGHKLLSWRLCLFAVTAFSLSTASYQVMAQGLSGPSQRLEETLGQKAPMQPNGQGGSGPPSGQGPQPGGPPAGAFDSQDMEGMEEMMDMEGMEEMMDMEGGYGGRGGPGASRSRSSGANQSDAMQTYASNLISLMGGLDISPLFAPSQEITVESGPILQREAEQAFTAGNEGLALELMFGHMTTEYQDAIVAIQAVKYSALLRRPVWNIRWGISMAVRGGDGLADPKPIREGANPNRRSMAGAGGGRGGPGEFDAGMEMEEMGGQDEGMEEEMSMEMEMDDIFGGQPNSRRRTAASRSTPAIPVRSMLSVETAETLDKTIGLVAKITGEKFTKRFQRGDFGPVLATVSAPPPVEPVRGGTRRVAAAPAQSSMSTALNDALTEAPQPLPMWKPGIVYLGLGTSEEIIAAAREANIDLVLHFDVILKPGRNETMQNICRCRIIHVSAGKSIGASKGIDSYEAAQLASTGRKGERDYVEQQLENLWGIIDRQTTVVDLPKLSSEVARRRIASLIGSTRSRSLRSLAEIRLYQAQQLIDESEVEASFDIIGGVDALMLLHGPSDERTAMVRKWAVESQEDDTDR